MATAAHGWEVSRERGKEGRIRKWRGGGGGYCQTQFHYCFPSLPPSPPPSLPPLQPRHGKCPFLSMLQAGLALRHPTHPPRHRPPSQGGEGRRDRGREGNGLSDASVSYVMPDSTPFPPPPLPPLLPPLLPPQENLIQAYKDQMKQKRCRYFVYQRGNPEASLKSCPFGSSCFYAHLKEDGTPLTPPSLRTRMGEEGRVEVVHEVKLSDFLEGRR